MPAEMLETCTNQRRIRDVGERPQCDIDVPGCSGLFRQDLYGHAADQCVRNAFALKQRRHSSQRTFLRIACRQAHGLTPDGAHLLSGGSGDVGVPFDEVPKHTREQIERYIGELAGGRTPNPRSRTKSIPPGVLIEKRS